MLEVNFSPFPEIRTSRLLLRCIALTDASALFYLRSTDETMQYIDREKLLNVAEAEVLIQKILDSLNSNDGIMWCISLIDKPEILIGTIGHWRLMKQHYRAEVGYMLHPDHWNKGIMKEALLAVIDYGFNKMNLHSIEAHINPDNIASAMLLEKAGFKREAYFKEDFFFRGRFIDTAIYSLLAP
ncbi:MAG: GNAT family N-acetyltransferase [Ferruginibacter sp.]